MTLPGGVLGTASGVMTETGYRLPYVVAQATIPVTDHEPCDGQWQGTVTYKIIKTAKYKHDKPGPSNAFQSGSGYISVDNTETLSGEITVNSKFGHDSPTNSSADENSNMDEFTSGKVLCSPKRGPQNYSSRRTQTSYGSGTAQGTTSVSIYLDKDYYQISVKPVPVKTIRYSTLTLSSPGMPVKKPISHNNSGPTEYDGLGFTGKASYGDDRNVLSGSDSKTDDYGDGSKVVRTMTWKLRRCEK